MLYRPQTLRSQHLMALLVSILAMAEPQRGIFRYFNLGKKLKRGKSTIFLLTLRQIRQEVSMLECHKTAAVILNIVVTHLILHRQ